MPTGIQTANKETALNRYPESETAVAVVARTILDANNLPIPRFPAIYQMNAAANTAGAANSANAWTTCPLAAETSDLKKLGVLATNQVTIQPGTYFVRGFQLFSAAAALVKTRLRDITNSATLIVGTSSASGSFRSDLNGMITLTVATVIEMQYYASAVGTLGTASGTTQAEVEVYAQLEFHPL